MLPVAPVAGQGMIGGTLSADTTLGIAESPWTITSRVTVPVGVTLTVEAGVRVEFDNNTQIVVDGGRMVADGTEAAPIVFGRPDGATHTWDGFVFEDTLEDNRLTHFSMEYGDDVGHSIEVTRARLTIQYGAWPTTEETMIELDEPSVLIEDSAIPGISGGEVIHGKDLVAPGWLILRRNTFGKASNGGDVIDFTGAEAPGPVLQIIDNVFMGGDDDGLDLDGTDAFVSGNIFRDFRKDPANTRATTSNAIATGLPQTGAPNRTKVTAVRNLFLNCDHAVLLKEEAFLTAENNTFVGMGEAVIQFNETGGTAVRGPGKGAILEGNIFWENAAMFKSLIETTELTINHCLIEAAFHDRGIANFQSDPGFVAAVDREDSIPPGSPVVGSGPNGIDRGFLVSAGASISGEPPSSTWRTEATLVIDGPAIRQYRYRLNGGDWSADLPIEDPIVLSGLSGMNQVEVIGQNEVGDWQAEVDASRSLSWEVDPAVAELVLNEVDVFGGRVELWNNSASEVDAGGYLLNGILISSPSLISPGGFIVIEVPGLEMAGGAVALSDSAGNQMASVGYGFQIPNYTLGRVGDSQDWVLTFPTPGSENIRQITALPGSLKLNEWLFNADCLFNDDFIELYNPEGLPVAMAGLLVEPEPLSSGEAWTAPALSYIAPLGYTAIVADGEQASFDVVGDLSARITLSLEEEMIDSVSNSVTALDVSEGRVSAGGESFGSFALPTPGFGVTVNELETTTSLIAIDAVWSYEDSDTDLGTTWQAPDYDDSAWTSGPALLGRETSPENLPETLETEVNYASGKSTYYFRHRFQFSGDPAEALLRMRTVVDDGAVFYLNGTEVYRLRMDDPVGHGTFASDNVGDANYEGPFDLSATGLVVGENVIAVEVHQDDAGSSDIVFGLELDSVVTTQRSEGLGDAEAILAGLRMTEIMYQPQGDGEAEFLELRNTGETSFDLEGLRFVEGVEFEFPSMVLAPGEFVYLVKDTVAFGHPELTVVGEYSGELADNGERLRLELAFGAGVVDVTYADGVAMGASGGGNSLELAEDGGLKDSRWIASGTTGGTFGGVSVFEDYAIWQAEVFSASDLADAAISGRYEDPDGDGLVNDLEHLFGSDPKMANPDLPKLEFSGDDLVFRYPQSLTADGALHLAVSDDLIEWSRVVPGVTGAVVTEEGGRQEIELVIPIDRASRRFYRIEGE